MKIEMTPEEHARLHRRRGRQALGLVIAVLVLVLIGVLTVLHAGVNAVAKLFDDTAQKQEYEDELEGLVLMIPRKGAEVAEITEKNMRDVLEVRKALEELAVQLACEKITDEEIEEMKKAAEEFKMILKSKDITEIAEADVRFHDIIYMATDNQKLILLLNNLREQMYRYRVEYLKREEAYPQLIAEHAAIIEYISKGEKKAATDVMCKHIDNQVTTVIDVIRTKQN